MHALCFKSMFLVDQEDFPKELALILAGLVLVGYGSLVYRPQLGPCKSGDSIYCNK
jgi:hypothetical protein